MCGVWTVGIKYNRMFGKTYHFATRTELSVGDTTWVKNSDGSEVDVKVVSVVGVIMPHVERWRSGSLVSRAVKEAYPYKPKEGLNKVNELVRALEVIRQYQGKLQQLDIGVGYGPSNNIEMSVSRSGDIILSGVSGNLIKTKLTTEEDLALLVNFVDGGAKKIEAMKRLEAIEKEASELRKILSK